jgi:gelsolin
MQTNNLVGTNLEFFGTDLEKKIKEASANCEPAWTNTNLKIQGLHIWRIEKFKLVRIEQNTYGSFFEGDSYVILNVYGDQQNELMYSAHFWLGLKTTQDEMGTAAYKTVELDTYLHGKAVQYREIQNNESDLFRSYFLQGITYLSGGIDSGFHKIEEYDYTNYIPLLYKVHDNYSNQMPLVLSSVTDTDAFVLDTGLTIYVYAGKNSSYKERFMAQYRAVHIKENRKKSIIVHTEDDKTYKLFLGYVTKYANDLLISRKLLRINYTNESITVTEIKEPITYDSFDTNDVFIFKTCHTTYVWIGKNSNYNEQLDAWKVAFKVSNPTDSIALVKEGREPETFKMNF